MENYIQNNVRNGKKKLFEIVSYTVKEYTS